MGRSRRSSRRSSRRILKSKRLLLVLGVLLFTSGSAYGIHRVQIQRQATNLLEVARAAKAEGDWTKAADFYKQYTNYRMKDAEGFSEYAAVLEQLVMANQRKWNVAATAYEKVLNIDPDRHADRKKVAVYYLRFGRWGAARPHLDALVKSGVPEYQNDPELYEMLAQCDSAERKPADVVRHLQQAVATNKAKPATYSELANLLRLNPNSALEADHVLNQLVAARPKDLEARLARARYRVRYGDRTGAIEDLRVAYSEIPGGDANIEIILQHAELLAETDRDAARKVIEAGLVLHPENTSLKLGLAELLTRSGSKPASAKILREAVAKLLDSDPQLLTIGDRLFELGETEVVLGIAKRMESDSSGALLAKYLLGRVAVKRGDWPSAIPALESAIPALGNRYDLLFKARMVLGESYATAGDLQRQEMNFALACALNPRSASANLAWANALVQLDRNAEAAEIYRAWKTVPEARTALALMKFREILGQPEEVRNWAEFEALLGPLDQLEPALEVAYAESLVWQNQAFAAERVLASAVDRDPQRTGAWIAMAELVAFTDLDAAWATLDAAEKTAGVTADVRLAKAQLLAITGSPIEPILQLADALGNLPANERIRLGKGIGSILASTGRTNEALALLQKTVAEQPYDLEGRYSLFDYALRSGAIPLAEAAFAEIQKLDGESGPVTTAAGFARDISRSGWLTPEQLSVWKLRIEAALQRRANWGRLQAIAGDIASLENRHGDALKHYLRAIELHDANPAILRRVAELLMEQQRYTELAALFGKPSIRTQLNLELLRQYELAKAAAGLVPREAALAKVRQPTLALSQRFREQLARASVFLRYGEQEEALDALRFAKALNDASPQVRVAIVRLLAQSGQLDAARKEVAEAEKRLRDPRLKFENPAEVPAALGLCKELVGDSAGAIAQYTTAAEAKPGDPQGWKTLYAAYRKAKLPGEADALLARLATSPSAEIARWARGEQLSGFVDSLVNRVRLAPTAVRRWW